jgi:predicted nucleic acid-binding protein
MPGRTRVFYWDACVFLAWLMDETRPPGEMEGIVDCVQAFESGRAGLATSALVFAEVSSARVSAQALDRFERLLRRRNVTVIDVGRRVARLAGELRDYYSAQVPKKTGRKPGRAKKAKTLSTPDAPHLATAILYDVDEFHTFDRRNKRNSLGLLPLDGDVAGHKLAIKKPSADPQIPLDLRNRSDAEDETETETDLSDSE